jgi:adenylate kinase family enzyme
MIIHIIGPSGSGKTTLGNRINKKFKNSIIIDTDDIDDPNSIKIINKYSFTTKTDNKKFDSELAKLNKIDINKILNENKNKNIIFVGFLHAGMKHLEKKIEKTYMIKIDAETLWRQYNIRTAISIHKNYKEIMKLLKGNMHSDKIHKIFSNKFGIRNGFDCIGPDDFKDFLKKDKKYAKENNFFYDTSNNIYKNICKLLKSVRI